MRDGLIAELADLRAQFGARGAERSADVIAEAIVQLREADDVLRRIVEDHEQRGKLPNVVIPPRWHRALAERVMALEAQAGGMVTHNPGPVSTAPVWPPPAHVPAEHIHIGDVIIGAHGRTRVATKETSELDDKVEFGELVSTDGSGNDTYRTIRVVHRSEPVMCWPIG